MVMSYHFKLLNVTKKLKFVKKSTILSQELVRGSTPQASETNEIDPWGVMLIKIFILCDVYMN